MLNKVLAISLLLLVSCAESGELSEISEGVQPRDAGLLDRPTPDGLTPRRHEPPTRASMLRHRAELARRVGNDVLATSLETQALSTSLVPRTPHAKPSVQAKCSNWVGLNYIRFKFAEGTNIRLDQSKHFFSDNGPGMTPQFFADLAVINAITDLQSTRLFDASDTELLESKSDAEKNTGEEQADLTLWYDGLVGPTLLEDITQDPVVCARSADLVNILNGLSIIEIAHPGPGHVEPPTLPFIAPSTATAPASMVFEPPHMGPVPQGLNSPLITASRLHPSFRAAWEGASMGIADIEYSFAEHEKVNAWVIPGGTIILGSGEFINSAHGTAAMSAAFGTAFSANDPLSARYGTRGFAPQARRAFSPQKDTEFFAVVNDIPEAVERAGRLEDPSDIILMETQSSPFAGSVVGPGGGLTASESLPAVYDTIRTFAGLGRIVVEAAGNGSNDIDTWSGFRPNSGALMVGANTGDGVTRAFFSGFGSRVDANAWGLSVQTAGPVGYMNPLTAGQPSTRHYITGFNGTSSASALVAGAVGQIVGTYRTTYGLGFARPSYEVVQTLRGLLQWTGTRNISQNIGFQPNVQGAVADFVLANRFTGCTDQLFVPHNNYVSVGVFGGTTIGLPAPWPAWSTMNCATRSNGSTNSGIVLSENVDPTSNTGPLDLGHNPDRSFLIEAWINLGQQSTYWQTIVAKENPRNYGLWVAPTGWENANRLHFSYWPEGSPWFCPVYSVRTVTGPGAWGNHHVAVRFDRRPGTDVPIITFFIDGTPDPSVAGCGAVPPVAAGWSGSNEVVIAQNLTAYSMVGDVRMYHRFVPDSEVAFHAQGGVW